MLKHDLGLAFDGRVDDLAGYRIERRKAGHIDCVAVARDSRFGLNEAHAKGMALQLNWLLDAGGFVAQPDGTFAVDFEKVKPAVVSLTREIMTIQAQGDYAAAKALLDKMVVVRPEVQRVLDGLDDVPVDIEPNYVTAKTFAR